MNRPKADQKNTLKHGPWNPGLESTIPHKYLPLLTLFREENSSTSFREAHELSDFSGIDPIKIVALRAERLINHELLLRIMADFAIDAGSKYADLGINVRKAARDILEQYIMPDIDEFIESHQTLKRDTEKFFTSELASQFSITPDKPPQQTNKKSLLNLFGWRKPAQQDNQDTRLDLDPRQLERRVLENWQKKITTCDDPFEKACFEALYWTVSSIIKHRGGLIGNHSIIITISTNRLCNNYGSEQLGKAIEFCLARAVKEGGYRRLPAQEKPVVMNVKGASAAGKSTMRQQQKALAQRLGVKWQDFALISPDIWRKYLLDYDSLGPAYKYAGMLSGHELEMIDQKLDRYMAQKAARGEISHFLIDRFRFDSFVADQDSAQDSKLLSRFGDVIFMAFMITPPDETVKRAWSRGLQFGRYKAVDDLLHHNVEAFTGMPQLFFNWAGLANKKVHYEFLDNSVEHGKLPRTIAFGWNGAMTVLDIKCLLDIDRYTKINIEAENPQDVYDDKLMVAQNNTAFLERCCREIPEINFANQQNGQIYGHMENGNWIWRDQEYFSRLPEGGDERVALEAINWSAGFDEITQFDTSINLKKKKTYTLGEWA